MKRIGTIYENIANECLTSWYPDMPESERKELLERGDLSEIESYIGAKNSIDAAIKSVKKQLEKYWIYLPDNFSEIVYHSITPNKDLESFIAEVSLDRIVNEELMSSIIVDILEEIHLQWVDDNKKKFFDPERRDKRYMFLPIEMIGWGEVIKDYIFVHPILQLLCIKPKVYMVQKAYESHRDTRIGDLDIDRLTKNIRLNLLYVNENISNEEVKEVVEQVVSRYPAFSR